jgi:hypothetical protein
MECQIIVHSWGYAVHLQLLFSLQSLQCTPRCTFVFSIHNYGREICHGLGATVARRLECLSMAWGKEMLELLFISFSKLWDPPVFCTYSSKYLSRWVARTRRATQICQTEKIHLAVGCFRLYKGLQRWICGKWDLSCDPLKNDPLRSRFSALMAV